MPNLCGICILISSHNVVCKAGLPHRGKLRRMITEILFILLILWIANKIVHICDIGKTLPMILHNYFISSEIIFKFLCQKSGRYENRFGPQDHLHFYLYNPN